MRIIADTHCHTIASTHAYSTVLENISVAQKVGLYALAITDHARNTPGAPGAWYFENLRVIPREVNDVAILRGIEANVLDEHGNIDVSDEEMKYLDWVIASFHNPTSSISNDVDACTSAWLNIAKNPNVRVIGHSGSSNFRYDYERVIPEFGKNGKLVEINNASFKIRKDAISNCKTIALLCKKYAVPVIVNSDAHFCTQVGNMDSAVKLLEDIDFPEELVVNANVERFKNYLKKYTHFFEKQ